MFSNVLRQNYTTLQNGRKENPCENYKYFNAVIVMCCVVFVDNTRACK